MKSKTLIDRQLQRKTNPKLVETIMKAKKNGLWVEVAGMLSCPARRMTNANLDEIDKKVKDGEVVVVAGKVLGTGSLTKRVKLIAFAFSKSAEDKLKKAKIDYSMIKDEIEKNQKTKLSIFTK
jgi:large subunit ribosomal protein L18e